MSDLAWAEICERFDQARNWWIATSGPDGPHSVPVWGVAIEHTLYFYGQPSGVRTRNLQADPRLVAHLESGDDVLILHGQAQEAKLSINDPAIVESYSKKYDDPLDLEYLPGHPSMAQTLLFKIAPTRAIAWELASPDNWVNRRWQLESS